jgi:hypothetical protein
MELKTGKKGLGEYFGWSAGFPLTLLEEVVYCAA